jgi:hypothetical protein
MRWGVSIVRQAAAKKGTDLMRCSEDQAKTISVTPGMVATADLSSGPLRFERVRGSMAGKPVYCIEDDMLTVHYADGASVYINT